MPGAGQEYLRELLTFLGFDLNETGFKKADGAFKSLIGLSAELVSRTIGVGAELFSVAVQAAEAGDAIRDTAIALGLTVSEVQELSYAASQSGVAFQELETALRNQQREADEARRGNKEARDTFERLGKGMLELVEKGTKTPELFEAVADRMAAIEDPAERTALALKLFGRSGLTLVPLLKEGAAGIQAMRARMRELGVITQEEADLSDAFNDSLAEGAIVAKVVKNRFGFALIPTFKRTVEWLRDLLLSNRELIDAGFRKLAAAVDGVVDAFAAFGSFLARHKPLVVSFASVIGLTLLPQMVRLAASMIASVTPAILMFLALASIALILDDIYTYATGGQSVIGMLFKEFLEKPPQEGEHWMVKVLREILGLLKKATDASSTFIDEFLKDVDRQGWLKTLGDAVKTAFNQWVVWIKDAISELIRWIAIELPTQLQAGIAAIPGLAGAVQAAQLYTAGKELSKANPDKNKDKGWFDSWGDFLGFGGGLDQALWPASWYYGQPQSQVQMRSTPQLAPPTLGPSLPPNMFMLGGNTWTVNIPPGTPEAEMQRRLAAEQTERARQLDEEMMQRKAREEAEERRGIR